VAACVQIVSAEFGAAADVLPALEQFYETLLSLMTHRSVAGGLGVKVGSADLGFRAVHAGTRPFHHFALLVPGDRFRAARDWFSEHAELLSRPGEQSTTFDFDFWNAQACYAADPAGNILELIAHHGLQKSGASGAFDPGELAGISEVGIVIDDLATASAELRAAGLQLWFGDVDGRLGFFGRRAHTLILSAPGRRWLPTLRPAEAHP